MPTKTTVDGFAALVIELLDEYADVCAEDMKKVVDEVTSESVKKLKQTSPRAQKHRNKDIYAQGWRSKVSMNKANQKTRIIYNATSYRRTMLLENGHIVVDRNGKKHDKTRAIPHIAPVEEWAVAEIERRMKEIGKK